MRRTLILTIAAVVAATMLSLTPAAGSATTAEDKQTTQPTLERGPRDFGAIALSYDNSAAGVYNLNSKRAAKRAAVRKCKQVAAYPGTCRAVVWVRNGCAAVTVVLRSDGSVTRYGWGSGRTAATAKRNALRAIPGTRDRVRYWVCTARRY
jgi:Domain of unknown function (DUF4189)